MKTEGTYKKTKEAKKPVTVKHLTEQELEDKYLWTIEDKHDITQIIKSMSEEEQNELIDWIIEKINSRLSEINNCYDAHYATNAEIKNKKFTVNNDGTLNVKKKLEGR